MKLKSFLLFYGALQLAILSVYPAEARADSADDHIGMCLTKDPENTCEKFREKFKQEYKESYKGVYQSQRNVAWCLYDGCYSSVRQNKILSCAWRMVILNSGSPKIDDTDISNFKIYCGKLPQTEQAVAKSQAAEIMSKIKK